MTQAEYEAYLARQPQKFTEPHDAVEDESDLHNHILEFCQSRGWIALHGSMAHRARRSLGEPDFTILSDRGRTFFFECKSKDGKLSTAQRGMIAWADKLGHTIHVIYSLTQFADIVDHPKLFPVPDKPVVR